MHIKKDLLRHAFLNYSYIVEMVYKLLDLLPPMARTLAFKATLGSLGKRTFIDYRVYFRFPWKVHVGSDVTIGRDSQFFPSFHAKETYIKIGNNVRIGPSVKFLAAGHDYRYLSLPDTGASITVSDNVWIGANSLILQGVTIGEGAVIAAGSIVNKSIPAYTTNAGVPAKPIKKRELNDPL